MESIWHPSVAWQPKNMRESSKDGGRTVADDDSSCVGLPPMHSPPSYYATMNKPWLYNRTFSCMNSTHRRRKIKKYAKRKDDEPFPFIPPTRESSNFSTRQIDIDLLTIPEDQPMLDLPPAHSILSLLASDNYWDDTLSE